MSSFFSKVSVFAFALSITLGHFAHAATALTEEQWRQVTEKTMVEGVRSDSLLGTLLTLTYKETIDENTYDVRYFSTLGQVTKQGYVIQKLTLVSERWSQVGENVFINQRSYIFDSVGNLENLYHREIKKTPKGDVSVVDVPTEGVNSANEHQAILKFMSVFVP